jgi:hypothetical protein
MMQAAQLYAMKLANSLTKITMEEFFKQIHSNFYPDQDISFMEYFLELTLREGKFVVPHSKLIDYGVITTKRSSNVLDKLKALNLEINKDFTLLDVQQRGNSGAQVHKQYMLTPEALKKCLMRAQRRANQPVDPTIYCDYYLRLEQAFKLYTDYERQYAKCLLAIKDSKIDEQSNKLDEQSNKIDQLLLENKQQSSKLEQQSLEIREVLANSRHIIKQNNDLHTEVSDLHTEVIQLNIKIDALFDFMLSFARMTIPTWIGSSIIKQQYETLTVNKDRNYALKHLKIMFMVGFYVRSDEPKMYSKVIGETTIEFKGRGHLKIYACCTNFADIGPRIKLLYARHTDDTFHPEMFMLKATAITLISCEINSERIILENSSKIFPEHSVATWDGKYKSFDLIIDTKRYIRATQIFKTICDQATTLRFQDYQQRIDKFGETTEVKVDPKIISYIDEADQQFFASTKPFCQQFINSYLRRSTTQDTKELVEYTYGVPSRKCKVRSDLADANMTTNAYALSKIDLLIDEHTSVDHIQYMTDNGILSKEDLPALRAIAKYENIDTSALEEEYAGELGDY